MEAIPSENDRNLRMAQKRLQEVEYHDYRGTSLKTSNLDLALLCLLTVPSAVSRPF
jgi:hypothetical protein